MGQFWAMKKIIFSKKATTGMVFLFCMAGFSNCKKETASADAAADPAVLTTNSIISKAKPAEVYVSGYEYDADGSMHAVYWKNGKEVRLDRNASEGLGIAVSDTNVYVVGDGGENDKAYGVAKYWKNGIAVDLTSGQYNAQATAIAVSGNDVYACGMENNGAGFAEPKYWKNGVATGLPYNANATMVVLTSITEVMCMYAAGKG
jgi:hypothetical protein